MQTQTSPMAKPTDAQNDSTPTLEALQYKEEFIDRHIGPSEKQIREMLDELQLKSLDELIRNTVPVSIALKKPLALATPLTENDALAKLKAVASKNSSTRSFIGLGYYDTYTPNVILRNVLENPGWYSAYTPYQPEISQGRLECLLNFQQMTLDFTAMELANASLLDEATAVAEAMALAKRVSKNRNATKFFVDQNCFPQTIDVIKTRAACFGFELIIGDTNEMPMEELFGAAFQYPSMLGDAQDLSSRIESLHQHNAIAVVAADLMSLALLKPPGEMGADVVTGRLKDLACPWGMVGHTLRTSPPKMNINVLSLVASSVFRWTQEKNKPSAWLYKHANNISVARKLIAISAQHRHFWQTFQPYLPCIMAPKE